VNERLIIVEDASPARGGGALLLPKLILPVESRRAIDVEVRSPDGVVRAAKAVFEVPHVRGDLAPFAALRLLDVRADDVPVGTEVWWRGARDRFAQP
jgi:hypothetical protein